MNAATDNAIANADAWTQDAGLPTYSELLEALRTIRGALAAHPEAQRGNSKVHFALHKASVSARVAA